MNLHTMTNAALMNSFTSLVQLDRKTTKELIEHLIEIEKRRAYVELGYPNAIDFLVRHYQMSESSAWRRVSAARALASSPDSVQKIETGVLNISTLAKTHAVIRCEEKRTGHKISIQDKAQIIQQIESKTLRQTEVELARKFPDQPKRDVVYAVGGDTFRAHLSLTEAQMKKMNRVRELLSHKVLNASLAYILDAALDEYLDRNDPLKRIVKERKSASTLSATEAKAISVDEAKVRSFSTPEFRTRFPKPSLRNAVLRESNGECSFVSPVTGVKCGARVRVQIDHKKPWALGGLTVRSNLRPYCQSHNLLAAKMVFS